MTNRAAAGASIVGRAHDDAVGGAWLIIYYRSDPGRPYRSRHFTRDDGHDGRRRPTQRSFRGVRCRPPQRGIH